MPRSVLLGSIVISIASLTLAQNSIPTSTSSTQTTAATQTAVGVQLADAGRTANVAPDKDALSTAVTIPTVNAPAVSKPQVNSAQSEKDDWFAFDKRPRLKIFPQLNLNGEGFTVFSQSVAAGFDLESKHLL